MAKEQQSQRTLKPREPIKAGVTNYTIKKKISDNLISLRPGDSLVIRVAGESKHLGGGVERWGKNQPPCVLPVTILPEEKDALLILPTVLESKFDLLGEDAIGKTYLIEAGDTVPDKRYRHFEVSEIELD